MTLEKDKEDLSKYYLSYSKSSINVVEWGNIPKFSKLDDIVTPLRLLELLFNNVLNNIIGGYTKSHREKAEISFENN